MIKELLRKYLLKEGHKNKFGCVMVYLDYDKKEWKDLLGLISSEDLYDPKGDPSFGKEDNPHVTVLFGLHDDIKDDDIMDKLKEAKAPKLKIKGVSLFETNPDYDVLKFDVESDDLQELNKEFKEFPHTNSFPKYHPHITLAYLKAGKGKEYVKKIEGQPKIEFEVDKFVYSKTDGSKKSVKIGGS